ncbi:MAG: hypothetical protein IKI93_17315 [Clostridia bacterium]|nr:hypothetical protein [Clostridia bacterium]
MLPAAWNVEGAYISAMRKVGNDVFLRLYTGTSETKTAKIRIPEQYTKYSLTDGLMEPSEWKPVNGEILLEMKPYRVAGIRFAVRQQKSHGESAIINDRINPMEEP